MHRFAIALWLVLAAFDIDMDIDRGQACARLRAMPTAMSPWCARMPAPVRPLADHAFDLLRGAVTRRA